MRKVIFQYWVPGVKTAQDEPANLVVIQTSQGPKNGVDPYKKGTNCFSEPQSGYFHCFGIETEELAEDSLKNTVAIIEHCTTGHVHKVDPHKFRFVQPPSKDCSHLEKEMD